MVPFKNVGTDNDEIFDKLKLYFMLFYSILKTEQLMGVTMLIIPKVSRFIRFLITLDDKEIPHLRDYVL